MFFFFFSSRRRHTRFDCDWSSDVCSSDLISLATQVGDYAVSEAFISPNGDGVKDSTVFSYRLPEAMPVTIQVSDEQSRLLRTGRPAGTAASGAWSWDGLDDEGRLVPDGRYELVVRNAEDRKSGRVGKEC